MVWAVADCVLGDIDVMGWGGGLEGQGGCRVDYSHGEGGGADVLDCMWHVAPAWV